jgi:hypothetical protein
MNKNEKELYKEMYKELRKKYLELLDKYNKLTNTFISVYCKMNRCLDEIDNNEKF